MSLATPFLYREPPRRDVARWLLAAAVVAALHIGIVTCLLHRQPPDAPGVSVDAVEIDLNPPNAPAPPAPDVAPAPPQEEKAETAPPPEAKPVEPPPEAVPPPPTPEAVAPPPSEAIAPAPAIEQLPVTPELPKPEVAVEPPKPDPALEEQRVRLIELQKEQRRQAVREQQRQEAQERQRQAKLQQQREAKRAAEAQKAQERRAAQAQTRAAASRQQSEQRATSTASLGSWAGQVQARVSAAKPNLSGGGSGVTSVSFTVDAGGRVGGARVSSSSGSSTLDQAAVSTIGRIGSVPPPPTGRAQTVNVRLRFGG